MINLKMAQMDWKKNKPSDYLKKPLNEWQTPVSPGVAPSRELMKVLQQMYSLGFDMDTQNSTLYLLGYHADRTLHGAVAEMPPEEFAKVIGGIKEAKPGQFEDPKSHSMKDLLERGAPPDQTGVDAPFEPMSPDELANPVIQTLTRVTEEDRKRREEESKRSPPPPDESTEASVQTKVSMRQLIAVISDAVIDLFKLILDTGLDLTASPDAAKTILSKLKYNPLQGEALALSDDELKLAITTAAGDQHNNTDGVVLDHGQLTPENTLIDGTDVGPGPVQTETTTLTPSVEAPKPTPPQAPAGPLKTEFSEKEVQPLKKTESKKSLAAQYEQVVKEYLPQGAKSAGYGDSLGVPVKAYNGKGSGGPAKGGMFVFLQASKEEAMVIGSDGVKTLYVIGFPDGQPGTWDVSRDEVRLSQGGGASANTGMVKREGSIVTVKMSQMQPQIPIQVGGQGQAQDQQGNQIKPGDFIQDPNQANQQPVQVSSIMPDGSMVFNDTSGQPTMKQPGAPVEVVKQDDQNSTQPIQQNNQPAGVGGPNML